MSNLEHAPVVLIYRAKGHRVVQIDTQDAQDLTAIKEFLANFISENAEKSELLQAVPSIKPIRINSFTLRKGNSLHHHLALKGDDEHGYQLEWSEATKQWQQKLDLIGSMEPSSGACHQYLNESKHGEPEVVISFRERRPDLRQFL